VNEKKWKMSKTNFIDPEYFLSGKDIDYSRKFEWLEDKILHIHWLKDLAVPLQSLHTKFPNTILVENWDHDMEKPDQIKSRLDWALDFLTN